MISRIRIAVVGTGIACLVAAGSAFAFGGMGMGQGSDQIKMTPSLDEPVKVEKASGADARTVAEIFEQAGKLDKKTVVVRGKVVKFSEGIMSKNWVHLKDGTGDAKAGTGKIIVTTQDRVTVGDVVTAKGTLAKDKDFGGGYFYKAIIEEGTISKK